ncbi:hypothetical protein [Aporhodopirellula aestuarii]|uniref:Uncharacterized protein n=1 Tax=Aporhodopirellula aestuarii TaxID=2950107 RepID=A0ABT0UEE8_9BACT|nr:hypothetical protein [Aporhodopirellula aestuarii]MCM2375270.1 hypothetical protein [Aporhodopirellula aestuarii]
MNHPFFSLQFLRDRDPRFLRKLLDESRPEILAEAADEWVLSDRQWEAEEAQRYLLGIPASPGHEVVVRRLIQAADERRRGGVLAAAMVMADQLVTHDLRHVRVWDYTQQGWVDGIRSDRPDDQVKRVLPLRHDQRREQIYLSRRTSHQNRLFSLQTRQYIRRFVWRSIRKFAKDSPVEFITTLSKALRWYPESFPRDGGQLLDAWCLMKACFGKHPGLAFSSRKVSLIGETCLRDLIDNDVPPPYASLWAAETGRREMQRIASQAASPFVRTWAESVLVMQSSGYTNGLNQI